MGFWTNDEVQDCLRVCSTALSEAAQKGWRTERRDIVYLVSSIGSLIELVPQTVENTYRRNSLVAVRRLLEAAILQHDKNFDSESKVQEVKSELIVENEEGKPQSISLSYEESNSRDVPAGTDSRNNTLKEARPNDELDSFSQSRRQAIESTIVNDISHLPNFADIAGLTEAKNALFEALVDPILYPDWFINSDLRPWKAVLLYGPPGTGKSALSQAIVKEISSVFYQISSSDLISTWSGQSERLVRELFEHATSQKRTTVIFIDEVDSLCRVRSSNEDDANRRVKTELLVQIQRLQETSRLVLICATNCPWDLDPAFLRRFEKKIYVGLPDIEARTAILQRKLSCTVLSDSVSYEWIASLTNGFSGDDLRRFACELAYTQFRYFKEEKQRNSGATVRQPLCRQDVEMVLTSFVPSVDKKQLTRFQHYNNK